MIWPILEPATSQKRARDLPASFFSLTSITCAGREAGSQQL